MPTLVLAVLAALLLHVAPAGATHPHPGPTSKKVVADLVHAYEPCTAPDTATDGYGYPACTAPVRSDPGCGYGPTGKGQLKIASSKSRLTVTARFSGLEPACEGSIIAILLYWRATGDVCGGESCTLTDDFAPAWGACEVVGGKCTIVPSGATFGFLPDGGRTGVELRGAEVYRNGVRAFVAGFVLP